MSKRKQQLLRYVLKKRYIPSQNRRRVGQSLILLTVFIFFIFLIHFAIIIGTDKKFGVDLSEGARKVHQTEVLVQAKRGTIYDRTGLPIAKDSTTYTIYAIIDKEYVSSLREVLYVESSQFNQVAQILNKYLGLETDYVLQQLNQPKLKQVYFGTLGKNISYSTMTAIQQEMETAGIKGIAFNTNPGRLYPNGNFASSFIGLANLVEDETDGSQRLEGQRGLEYALNSILAGQDGKVVYEKDSRGRIVPGTENIKEARVDGQDVYTTLSADLQRSLETNMDVFADKTKGKYINATLVSAKTGEILATTQRPTYNPDTKEGVDNKDILQRSLLYQDNFEPGSTMKVMTVAAAIDNGTFTPNEYYNRSEIQIADAIIRDWDVNAGDIYAPLSLTYAQGFALSSNVGMTLLEQKMGDERWLNYLEKFRFGYPTRFGMAGEEAGILPENNVVSVAMTSFGQGLLATQTQMLRGFGAVANNGVMLEPKFITALYDSNTDSVRLSKPEVVGKPVSEKAATDTRQYMISVGTDPHFGTLRASDGAVIQVDGYNIAVKSGTAQIGKEDGTGYMEGPNDTINSVVAMVPAEDPEFIMYVTVQQPESWSILYWRDILNPSLKEAMQLKDSLNLTTPAPTLTTVSKETEYKLGKVIGQQPGVTASILRQQLVQPIILGNGGEIKKVSVDVGSNLVANQQILLLTDKFERVPDLYGWTKENVDIFAEWTGIEIEYSGSGSIAVGQSVAIGNDLEQTKKIRINLGE
ncbi:penicillin-binding protein [Streptococcus azizii]|uniref:Penicillin-binding protein n=1 Tax=Streptococcus azizii TaxID=1579424 RepID=A0AB36JN81_9STRE|nr:MULTISPECIES: penicillin-binding protein PBP2X [Streptococcus]MBF0776770.1 penicillin-binding protein [Streptococcus sp. 19428wD3_AN2]ONK25640.1 penicillin-binding protein [Streptococcus azizii]ONK26024.1 penicillin-binding protein [Streptococcus azizii]ONK26570.1 penicillin-binding protein [Streptococcus azizii]TFU82423.1 penicillin-binding protein [Streptococcus sp. AN2]